jgi:hypothetical protein
MSITAGLEPPNASLPRRSIGTGERIPNAAIFLKRTALEFLQVLFSQRAPGSFHYDEDDTKSEIIIADMHAVDLTAVASRPAIIAARGPLDWRGTHLGAVEHRDIPTGDYIFKELLAGSVALTCISREGIEAEQIGHIVFNSFKYFRPVLQKYGFFQIKSLNIGAETLIEQEGPDDKTTAVPIYVSALIEDRWSLSDKAARKLEQIIVTHVFDVG